MRHHRCVLLAHLSTHPAVVFAVHIRHHLHGPAGDYLGLAAAAVASWAGVPGPGEAALITAGILAAHHHIDIAEAVVVAWMGATAGGTVGWLVGLRAGRAVVAAPGPLYNVRMSALERGDRFYERFGPIAVFFTPSWVAGIHGMRARRFLPANAIAALVWALVVGVGAYFAGPPIVELVSDLGLLSGIVVGCLVVAAAAGAFLHRSRRARRRS
jgi:membrane protein DedA with SNARE-associated domain